MSGLILVYDTETTGLPDWHQPSDAPQQPHLVQLAAALVNAETRQIVQSLDLIIRPDGWEIPQEVTEVHGISTEYAKAVGVREDLAVMLMLQLWCSKEPRLRVGHNEQFDSRIIRIALKRYCPALADEWKAGSSKCTAKLASPICKLPPTEKMVAAGRNHPKTPTLTEAYQHFTGQPLDNAHTAMADVQACIAVYWHIQETQMAKEIQL